MRSFKEELEQVAKATKKPSPEQWIEAKVGFMDQAWKDLGDDEMVAAAKESRFAYPVYVDPEHEVTVVAVVGERLRAKAQAQIDAANEKVAQALS